VSYLLAGLQDSGPAVARLANPAPHVRFSLFMRGGPIKAGQERMGHATMRPLEQGAEGRGTGAEATKLRHDSGTLNFLPPVVPFSRFDSLNLESGGAGSRTHVKGPNRNEARRGLTHQTYEIVWTGRSRSLPRRPT
jgi:hypothetical protein